MTVIQNIVKDAAGNPLKGVQCLIRLVGAPAFDTVTSSETVTVSTVTTDLTTGQWSIDLTPVSHYSTAGCYYTVNEPGGTIRSFTVPDSGGPYWLNTVLTVAPTAPEASLGVVRYDADQSTVLTSAQQAQARANIGAGTGGGGGAVASVNGQTGAVVLGAADVGADVAGAAATAQTNAEAYTDSHITALGLGTAATHAATDFDTAGSAASAQAAAIAASQPVDSDLTAIAALTTTTFGRSLLTSADAAALRTAAALGTAATQPSTAFDASGAAASAQAASQPLDSDLTAIAALTTTSFGRSFLALADAAAGRTLLALGGSATLNVGTATGTVAAGDDSRITGAVQKSTVTAKGDLIVATASGAVTNLAVGPDGTVPVADSTQAGGWRAGRVLTPAAANPSASGMYVPVTMGQSLSAALIFSGAALGRGGAIPFALGRSVTPTSFSINCTTAAASSFVRLGIYADNGSGKPGALLQDYGQVDTSTTGIKTWANTTAFAAGTTYWHLIVVQGAGNGTVQVTSQGTSAQGVDVGDPSASTAFGNIRMGYDISGVTGAMPSNITSSAVNGGVNNHVRLLALIP